MRKLVSESPQRRIQKIMIMGRPGGGKSTCAVKLAKALSLPIFHLDKYFFEKNWIERDYQEFLSLQKAMIAEPAWIIDGNSTKSLEMRYACADLCLYFNFPRRLCYWRVFKRLFYKHSSIDDRAPDCPETIRWSLLKYMWNFEERVDPILKQLQLKYPHVRVIELHSDAEVSKLMHQLWGDEWSIPPNH